MQFPLLIVQSSPGFVLPRFSMRNSHHRVKKCKKMQSWLLSNTAKGEVAFLPQPMNKHQYISTETLLFDPLLLFNLSIQVRSELSIQLSSIHGNILIPTKVPMRRFYVGSPVITKVSVLKIMSTSIATAKLVQSSSRSTDLSLSPHPALTSHPTQNDQNFQPTFFATSKWWVGANFWLIYSMKNDCTGSNSWLLYLWMRPCNNCSNISLLFAPFWQLDFCRHSLQEWKWGHYNPPRHRALSNTGRMSF